MLSFQVSPLLRQEQGFRSQKCPPPFSVTVDFVWYRGISNRGMKLGERGGMGPLKSDCSVIFENLAMEGLVHGN